MDKDILYNILLQLSAEDLKNMCMVNNTTLSICDNPHFWKDKMINDDIPMIYNVSNINDYIDHYELKKKAIHVIKYEGAFSGVPNSIVPVKILKKIPYQNTYHFTIRYLMNKFVVNTSNGGAVLTGHELLHFLMTYHQYKKDHPNEFKLSNNDSIHWNEFI
jgi:hypothetical protein